MASRVRTIAVAAGLAILATPPAARADDRDPEVLLGSEAEASRRWYYTWSTAFAVATVAEVGIAASADDREKRVPAVVSAVTSGIGFVSTIALPPKSGFAITRLRAMPNDTPEHIAARRGAAEKALLDAADEQRLGTSWLAHAGGVVVNLAAGLVLWRGYGQLARGALAFGGGVAISELKIASQPAGLVDIGPVPHGIGLSMRGAF